LILVGGTTRKMMSKKTDLMYIESEKIKVLVKNRLIMRNINLPQNIVFVCMVEIIVLAFESRYEKLTIGHNIKWEKIKKIYKLGLKHGMKISSILGANGFYKKKDIDKIRTLALGARGTK
jgi:hypothetical protein